MDNRMLLIIIVLAAGLVCFALLLYFLVFRSKTATGGLALGGNRNFGAASTSRDYLKNDPTGGRYEELKKFQRKGFKRDKAKTQEVNKYLQAGIYREDQVRRYEALRFICPVIFGPLLGFGFFSFTPDLKLAIAGAVIGVIGGIRMPNILLDRKIKKRADEIMYFLPLVIEQIAIGVSSSLDIGPCLNYVVEMADKRDKHNVVTELVRRALYLVRSGSSLQEALVEIGNNSGHNELKHTFIALAQVSKHGGEISKQLMELAHAVNTQREVKVDAKIKKLELEATGPVALVFLGFLIILLIGFGVQIKNGLTL